MKNAPGRLALRIYIVSLAQLFTIVGSVIFVGWIDYSSRPKPDFMKYATNVGDAVGPYLHDPVRLKRHAEEARSELRALLTVYDAAGKALVSNVDPPVPPISSLERQRLVLERVIFAPSSPPKISVTLDAYAHGAYVVYVPRFPPPPITMIMWALGIALIATAIASVLLARSLAQPLAALSSAARSLGAGDMTVRARLKRRDEFGQLSESFDEMADRLAQLVRSQQELLANVSHELRTPLARIRVALDLAAEGDASDANEALGEIREDLAELEGLVSDVLQNARLDLAAGRAGSQPPLRPDTVDLTALLDRAASRFRAKYPERQLVLRVLTPLPALTADAVMLRRALENLLDNARKYSDVERPIEIAARCIDRTVEMSVEDRGIGISSGDLGAVATPFFRTDRSRARRSGGLGLGLSLARRILEAHGGQLVIESQLGVGTRVRLLLPAPRTSSVDEPRLSSEGPAPEAA